MTRPLHITALAPYKIFPAKTGGQKAISFFYKYFSNLAPVTIISTKNNELPTGPAFSFLPILGNSRLRYINPFLFFTFKRIIRENKSTHFIIEHPYFGWLGILLKKYCSTTFVIRSHNIESLRFKSTNKWWWRLLWQYEKYAHRHADASFFITEADRQYAISSYKTDPAKCHVITYGIEVKNIPAKEEKEAARKKIETLYNIGKDDKILFFNGALNYAPNLNAVDFILKEINPLLSKKRNFPYKIVISGMGLPGAYQDLLKSSGENIIYIGFVDDIDIHFKAADIFINPVSTGGGIKTKLVEALGFNISAVSAENGATGVSEMITANKLMIVPGNNKERFIEAILATNTGENTPQAFYDHFFWGHIAQKALKILI